MTLNHHTVENFKNLPKETILGRPQVLEEKKALSQPTSTIRTNNCSWREVQIRWCSRGGLEWESNHGVLLASQFNQFGARVFFHARDIYPLSSGKHNWQQNRPTLKRELYSAMRLLGWACREIFRPSQHPSVPPPGACWVLYWSDFCPADQRSGSIFQVVPTLVQQNTGSG